MKNQTASTQEQMAELKYHVLLYTVLVAGMKTTTYLQESVCFYGTDATFTVQT